MAPAGHASAQERRRSIAAIAPYFVTAPPAVSDDDPTGELPRVRGPQGRPPASGVTTESTTASPARSVGDDTGHDTSDGSTRRTVDDTVDDAGHDAGHDTGHDISRAGDERAAGDTTEDRWGAISAEPASSTPGEPEPSLRLAAALDALVHEVWGDDDPRAL
ncbi:MAG: hypothetical protein M3N57_10755 [Actinomycetota bacterium]|nr:hypothetical protein [Actinomycetota bacterium]